MTTSSPDPPQSDHTSPLESLLLMPGDHELTVAEVTETLTALINFVRREQPDSWQQFIHGSHKELLRMTKDKSPHGVLEETYMSLQEALMPVRQATAQAIATEKQLERQLKKNQDQADTWLESSRMALEQMQSDLSEQALQRRQQYLVLVDELTEQLGAQREGVETLRQHLLEMEREVQKAYTKKQVLWARENAAVALTKANETIATIDLQTARTRIAESEKRIEELETLARALRPKVKETDIESNDMLRQVAEALSQSSIILKALEHRLTPKTPPETSLQEG